MEIKEDSSQKGIFQEANVKKKKAANIQYLQTHQIIILEWGEYEGISSYLG